MNNNRFILPLLALLCVSFFTYAQEPQKPTFEKRVFIKDGNTYVQKQLPLYLKFSTDPGGKNYDLKSKSTPQYADPMYLDTEGPNYIRSRWAVNKTTLKTAVPQQEILYEIYADGIAPITSSSFSGAPRYYARGTVYYGKGLRVNLSANDAVSGVEAIHYSLNGEAYNSYANTLTFTTDKANTLYYYSHDNVGNSEVTRSKKFTVDLTPPSSNHTIVGISHNGNIIAPSTRFRLSSSDGSSGVNATYYELDSRGRRVYYGSPVGVSGLNDGNHTIYYYAKDNVRNEETRQSFAFYLDRIPPVLSAKIDGDQYRARGRMYVSERSKVNLSATDNKAGVAHIKYRLDGGGTQTYSSPFGIPNRLGTRYIQYYSTDNVQNRTNNKSLAGALGVSSVYMDNRKPITAITYGQPQFFHRDTLFVNSTTRVTLRATDYESGVKRIDYSVNGSGNTYSSPFTMAGEGYKTITFQATDNVNNQEQQKTSNAFVDNTPPVIYHNFSISHVGTKKRGGQTLKIYPNYTRLYLGATDAHCGTDKITYSINGAPFADYSSPYTLDISEVRRFRKNKLHTVVIKATDKLGNESSKTVEFYIGE